MTQAITAITSVAPLAPAVREPAPATAAPALHVAQDKSDSATPTPGASQDKAAPVPTTAPPPLKLTVAKSVGGIFVYTLTDPGSGAVVAVIPLVKLQSSDTGTQVDQKV